MPESAIVGTCHHQDLWCASAKRSVQHSHSRGTSPECVYWPRSQVMWFSFPWHLLDLFSKFVRCFLGFCEIFSPLIVQVNWSSINLFSPNVTQYQRRLWSPLSSLFYELFCLLGATDCIKLCLQGVQCDWPSEKILRKNNKINVLLIDDGKRRQSGYIKQENCCILYLIYLCYIHIYNNTF